MCVAFDVRTDRATEKVVLYCPICLPFMFYVVDGLACRRFRSPHLSNEVGLAHLRPRALLLRCSFKWLSPMAVQK